jgi:hypothetical protein
LYTLTNAGVISGIGPSVPAVEFQNSGGDLVKNTGQISGAVALDFQGNVAAETVENSGTITGKLLFNDASGITSSVDNAGTILGLISSTSDTLDINNSGTIHSFDALELLDGTVTNSFTGAISGNINFSGSQGFLDNAGTIDGFIALANGGIKNAGRIDGSATFLGTGQFSALTNSGTITGAVGFTGSADYVNNAGAIDGTIQLESGNSTFINTNDVDGGVTFTGTGGSDTMTNSGAITGDVTMAGTNSKLTNHNQIYGDVTLASSDTLTNTGTIHGNVTLGASDTIHDSRGAVTGSFTAAKSDIFDYNGLFGAERINNFVASGISGHDVIQFTNDFHNFAQVQAAASQVTTVSGGIDTVIQLDASDSITLIGRTLSQLGLQPGSTSSVEFRFV